MAAQQQQQQHHFAMMLQQQQQQQAQQQQMFLQQYGLAASNMMQQMAAGGPWQQSNRAQPGSPSAAAAQFAAAFPFGNPNGSGGARSVPSYPAHPMASRGGPMQQYAAARAAAAATAAGNGARPGLMHSAPAGAAGNAGATHGGAGVNNGATSRAPPGLQQNGTQQNGAEEDAQNGVKAEQGADVLTSGTANATGRERRMQVMSCKIRLVCFDSCIRTPLLHVWDACCMQSLRAVSMLLLGILQWC